MTKREFLDKLKKALVNDLSGSVIQENVNYYNDYITEEVRKGRRESDVIEELAIQFKEMINRELVSIKVSIEDDIPNGLIGDCSKIKEILLNLYQRAAKTTKEGSISISVDWRTIPPEECEKEDSIYLDIEISDTGTGVKEERLDSFFDPVSYTHLTLPTT